MNSITVIAKKGEETIATTLCGKHLVHLLSLHDIYLVQGSTAESEQDARDALVWAAEEWDRSGWRLADGDPVVRELGKVDIDWLSEVCGTGTIINPPADMEAMLLGCR